MPCNVSQRRIVVVTGGSAGVGRAVVREFAKHGYDVAILARGEAGLKAAAADVEGLGGRALPLECDVSSLDEVEVAAKRVEAELGQIDVWVNVAFVGALRFFWDTSDTLYRRITDVTYMGFVNGTRVALALMRRRDRGVIVQVGSALGHRGIPLQSAYCGAKHAIRGFTESVITELIHERSKVRVCMVDLPGVNTPQFDWNDSEFDQHPMPVPPIFQPEVPARMVRYVAEHPRRSAWVGFPTAKTIIGNRVAPWFLDWYLGRKVVQGQLSDTDGPRRGSNAFEPKDEDSDAGAHGMFDDQARSSDLWSWTSMHRSAFGAGAVVATVGAVAARLARSRR
jgi:NAD(P)-dependent dehydrogenase (short-subunit alcohol dehydrogenase family)